ncbi:MAG: DNA-formamidopyrimidine glycosylase [Candidatus Pacebacteria bacterium]|nr:DNA-formamidopyrimidine glycosylase [Candidatus Paceibacterota bacterium]
MPELPEVETTTRGLKKTVLGLVIKDVWTDLATKDKRKRDSVANPKFFRNFKKEVLNKKIISAERRAKNILINLSEGKTILVHMKMTGYLFYGKDPKIKFAHVVFTLSNPRHGGTSKHYLIFSDMRKFGKITLLDTNVAHDPEGKITSYGAGSKHLNNIGPEPLEKQFTITNFELQIFKKQNGKIKTVLMDQRIIAGIGNIYSDEILWRAGVHPERKVSTLKKPEIKLIFKAIKETLAKGIDFGGDSMSDYKNIYGLPGKFQLHHEAYRRTGEKCRKKGCKGTIIRKIINGRSAHFCSVHQK